MSNSSEEFSYPTINSNFKILHVYQFINFFSYLAYTQTDRLTDGHTDRMTYRDECSILALNRKYTCGLNRKYNELTLQNGFLKLKRRIKEDDIDQR